MRFAVAVTVGLALLSVAFSTRADWQYTKWGMSVQELAAAAPPASRLRKGPPKDGVSVVAGDYSTGGFQFESRLEFEDNNLMTVRLILRDGSLARCSQLADALKSTYGNPIKTGFTSYEDSLLPVPYSRWRDKQDGNIATLIGIEDCVVVYRPIDPPRKRGNGL